MSHQDVMMDAAAWDWVDKFYLLGADARHSDASPALGDWHGLPPLQLHVSDKEVLLDSMRSTAERARRAGVQVSITEWAGMPHSFAFMDMLPEARQCRDQIVAFTRQQLR
jgi:acetyl esterase/lipase